MQPQQQNPYDFILNEQVAPQKQGFKFNATNKKQRLAIVAAGGLVLLIIAVIIFNLLGNIGKKDINAMYHISASQQDLIKLSQLGVSNIRTRTINGQLSTAGIILTGQNKETTTYISGLKIKNSSKKIATYKDNSYTNKLDDARKNGNYDDVFVGIFSNRLDEYNALLRKTYAETGNQKIKAMLAKFQPQLDSISLSNTSSTDSITN
jgi:hypothetical protein